jgi:hypothetical protein
MRLSIIAALILLFSFGSSGQRTVKVIPGVGAGELKLGMTKAQVNKLLGTNYHTETYLENMRSYFGLGEDFAIDSVPQFVLDFDEAIIFNKTPKNYPVYSIFFLNGKVNLIKLSTYVSPDSLSKAFSVDGVRLLEKSSVAKKKFGKDFIARAYRDYEGHHIYYKRGMEATYDNGKFTVVSIFTADADYLGKIQRRSERLKFLYEALQKADEEEEEEEDEW